MTRAEILAIAKPILFNTDMVVATLENRKSETRRVVKLPQHIKEQENGLYTLFADGTCYDNQHMQEIVHYIKPPYKVGDYLYVRETWQRAGLVDDFDQVIESTMTYYYAAGPETPCFEFWVDSNTGEHKAHMPWRPSIHMPKEAARIFLRVTDVRVERLQDISSQDIFKEGITICVHQREIFSELWDSTIPKKDLDKYGWDANPWVWVIEFERVKEEDD